MNVTQFVSRLRSYLDDARVLKFTDLELVQMTDEQLRYLTRKLSQTSKDWHNFSIGLKKTDARTLFQKTFEWTLPSWVKRVSRVYQRRVNATSETTLSPYRWTGGSNVQLGEELAKSDTGNRRGWTWEGTRTLRLWNYTEAMDLSLEVVKMPAPLFKGTIAVAFPDTSGFYLPPTLTLGELYTEEGTYINSDVQVTSTQTATATTLGEVRRVVYSNSNTIAAGRKTPVYVDNVWPSILEVGDVVESTIPIPEDHTYLLALLVLRGLSVKKGNLDLQKSVGNAIGTELQDFLESAGLPKDSAGPYFKNSRTVRSSSYDQDRLNASRFQWW